MVLADRGRVRGSDSRAGAFENRGKTPQHFCALPLFFRRRGVAKGATGSISPSGGPKTFYLKIIFEFVEMAPFGKIVGHIR